MHSRKKSDHGTSINPEFKKNFNVRPVDLRTAKPEQNRLDSLFTNVRKIKPSAVALTCIQPPKEFSCPPTLPQIAEHTLISHFLETLCFNEMQFRELEKAARSSLVWKTQLGGCMTGSKIRDIFTKVNSLARSRAKKPKVTPLIARIFRDFNKSGLDAVKYAMRIAPEKHVLKLL